MRKSPTIANGIIAVHHQFLSNLLVPPLAVADVTLAVAIAIAVCFSAPTATVIAVVVKLMIPEVGPAEVDGPAGVTAPIAEIVRAVLLLTGAKPAAGVTVAPGVVKVFSAASMTSLTSTLKFSTQYLRAASAVYD
jgi:hypothetical protein